MKRNETLTCMVCKKPYDDHKTTAVFRFLCSMTCQRIFARKAGFDPPSAMTIVDFSSAAKRYRATT